MTMTRNRMIKMIMALVETVARLRLQRLNNLGGRTEIRIMQMDCPVEEKLIKKEIRGCIWQLWALILDSGQKLR